MSENVYKTIRVVASKSYDVLIGKGILEDAGELITECVEPCKALIITDSVVNELYENKVNKSLTEKGFDVKTFVFKNGEESKNIFTFTDIQNYLAENKFTRTDIIVALGGGVVGDMAGFVASTYMRGIKFIQIPTTLLAQIDSSVGGKTAIDLEKGKNLVGAFYQPELVICDTNTLDTLDKETFEGGMGEVIKYAVLDKKIFDFLERKEDNILELVSLCIEYKRNIVYEDEFEGGKRKLLNLGHTIAHGIEKLSNYTIPHGRAVKMGMAEILKASKNKGYIDEETYTKIESVIFSKLKKENCPFDMTKICEVAGNDKKCYGDKITLVMVHGVGNVKLEEVKIKDLGGYFI